ncbi:MAG: hypothetical protein PHH99_04245 [Pseudomonas fluorescens]|nr:hypothetical protein [Pseudomonas fluorescens]
MQPSADIGKQAHIAHFGDSTMKIKPLLFMFALGLGSATVYADTPREQCLANCEKIYERCNGAVWDAPDPWCIEQRTYCQDPCDQL